MDSLKEDLHGQGIATDSLEVWKGGYRLLVPCPDAVAAWLKLRALVPRTGLWPVLREAEDLDRDEGPHEPADQLIRRAESIVPADWFARRHRENQAELEQAASILSGERFGELPRLHLGDLGVEFVEGGSVEAARPAEWLERLGYPSGIPRGPWPEDDEEEDEDPGPRELSSFLTRSPSWVVSQAAVVLLPTRIPWHVPAILGFGGWNACPAPEEHAAVWKSWGERHDAEVMTITHDVVEMRVGRPLGNREAALALALEQYLYCPDIVEQGTETLERLAAGLLESPVWYFWWD
jgi:hypothetical protein